MVTSNQNKETMLKPLYILKVSVSVLIKESLDPDVSPKAATPVHTPMISHQLLTLQTLKRWLTAINTSACLTNDSLTPPILSRCFCLLSLSLDFHSLHTSHCPKGKRSSKPNTSRVIFFLTHFIELVHSFPTCFMNADQLGF